MNRESVSPRGKRIPLLFFIVLEYLTEENGSVNKKEKNQPVAPEAVQDPQNTAADLDAIMRKYDRESNVRVWEGKMKILVGVVLAAFSLYCMYVTLFANMLDQVWLSSFLGLVVIAGYLIYPARKGRVKVNHMPWYDIVLMVLGAVAFFYYTFKAQDLMTMRIKAKLNDPVYVIAGAVGLLVLFRMNTSWKDSLVNLLLLYCSGVLLGMLLGPILSL